MIITHKLEMDMVSRSVMPRIDVVQGDSNTRRLELTLLSDGDAWPVPEDAVVWMRYCKSDGTKGIYDTLPDGTAAWSAEENVLTIVLAPQMLTAAGTVLAQAELVQGAYTLATFSMQIAVERNPAADALTSEDYLNMLQWMETELDRLLAEARDSGEFDGPQGEQGPQGETGTDIFDYAVEAGYAGTEAEFKEMLITPCLPLSGGTMAGEISLDGKKVTGLGEPEASSDAVTKAYADAKRQVLSLTLYAAQWTETAPYTQTVLANGLLASDWPRMEPLYTGVEETDRPIHGAFSCIGYGIPLANRMTFFCLDSKPEADIPLRLEVLR